ncbi:cytochrome P450 [Nocardia tengchongensis]|uniref:cytochrome P450 n=1 Tax=Nocardia tengchongensis TaxID=2055889 RepID=UPI003692CA6B
MYSAAFAADPHSTYERWRTEYGSLVPVELAPGVPATLVIGYATALRILNDPDRFPADPRRWQASVPSGCPVLPMMEWRPNALRSTGYEHKRYRQVNVTALDTVDLHGLHAVVEQFAVPLVNTFCRGTSGGRGERYAVAHAELLGQYIRPLVYRVLAFVLGLDPDTNELVSSGMAAMFDAAEDANAGSALLVEALDEHIRRKQARPGADVTSQLIRAGDLSTDELIHQLVTLHAAGSEPLAHLISNTLLLMMTDERFAGGLLSGSLSTRDALDDVLFTNPPMANYCISYPPQSILIDGVWLPAHQPVVISMAGCNNDPAIRSDLYDRSGNRSHLAWGAGPHQCPARQLSYQVAADAIDYLLDVLPEIDIAVAPGDLVWRRGPFHRALESLPVRFPESVPLPL